MFEKHLATQKRKAKVPKPNDGSVGHNFRFRNQKVDTKDISMAERNGKEALGTQSQRKVLKANEEWLFASCD